MKTTHTPTTPATISKKADATVKKSPMQRAREIEAQLNARWFGLFGGLVR